jgi:hypothetical protein
MSRRLLFAAFAFALAGCPGSLEDPGRFTGGGDSCSDIPTLFASSCATTGCHASESPSSGLDLASADIYGRLKGKKAAGSSGLLIDPDSPESSVLYEKVTPTPPFGSRMPLSGAPFDDATVACVLTWIEKGGSP